MATLRTAKRFVFPLLGIWVLLYASFSMVKPPLLDGSDALSAEIAREMITAGHWLTPFANGVRYPHQPPFLYWTIAVSFGIFDISDWAYSPPTAYSSSDISSCATSSSASGPRSPSISSGAPIPRKSAIS
jgi:4-amino-4-deoxy-L-arabinose transferase-like glycosyltransferase